MINRKISGYIGIVSMLSKKTLLMQRCFTWSTRWTLSQTISAIRYSVRKITSSGKYPLHLSPRHLPLPSGMPHSTRPGLKLFTPSFPTLPPLSGISASSAPLAKLMRLFFLSLRRSLKSLMLLGLNILLVKRDLRKFQMLLNSSNLVVARPLLRWKRSRLSRMVFQSLSPTLLPPLISWSSFLIL